MHSNKSVWEQFVLLVIMPTIHNQYIQAAGHCSILLQVYTKLSGQAVELLSY